MRRMLLLLVSAVAVMVASAGLTGASGSTQARWVIRDLGTLGGGFSEAVAINDRGEVVGWSETARGARHAFVWREGKMLDLGTLGGSASYATAINERGEVVGMSSLRGGRVHAFRWRNGKMIDLGVMGKRDSAAVAINGRGHVVGTSGVIAEAVFSDPDRDPSFKVGSRAFVWQNGKMRNLGTLGGPSSVAVGINERAEIVGRSGWVDGKGHAVLWRDGEKLDLGTNGSSSTAVDVNDRGQVVGWSSTGRFDYQAFLWQRGVAKRLGGLEVGAINNRGQVVGDCATGVCVWDGGRLRSLGSIGYWHKPAAINDLGRVVGNWGRKAKRGFDELAFVSESGRLVDLGTLGGVETVGRDVRTTAFAINNKSQIVGSSFPQTGARHAVLWTLRNR